jgi:hypothetical protein
MGAKFKCPDDNITFSAVRRFQAGMAPEAIVDELVGLNVDRACAEKVVARVVESFGKPSEEALQQSGNRTAWAMQFLGASCSS